MVSQIMMKMIRMVIVIMIMIMAMMLTNQRQSDKGRY